MALSKTRTFFDGLRECLNFLSHERGAPQGLATKPKNTSFLLLLERQQQDGGEFLFLCYSATPSPQPSPKGRGSYLHNLGTLIQLCRRQKLRRATRLGRLFKCERQLNQRRLAPGTAKERNAHRQAANITRRYRDMGVT